VGLTWTNDTFSYFTLVNDFSRRTKLASKATMSELANPVYDLTALSDQKRQVLYTQENIFRTLIGVFESIVLLYGAQVSSFGLVATDLVAVICAIIACNVFCIAVFTLRALTKHMQNLQVGGGHTASL
jgi:hypothetical protein